MVSLYTYKYSYYPNLGEETEEKDQDEDDDETDFEDAEGEETDFEEEGVDMSHAVDEDLFDQNDMFGDDDEIDSLLAGIDDSNILPPNVNQSNSANLSENKSDPDVVVQDLIERVQNGVFVFS